MRNTNHFSNGLVTIEEACEAAGRVLAAMRRNRDELAAHGGPEAVAEAAYVPGGPSRAEVAALYERLRTQAMAMASV